MCASDSSRGGGGGGRARLRDGFFKAYLFSDVCFRTVLKVRGRGTALVSLRDKAAALSFPP